MQMWKTIDLSTAPLHPIDCMNSQWHWIKRHNDTRDLLRDFLKAQSNLDLHKIMLEPEVTTPGGEPVHTTGAQMPAQRAGVTSVAAWREHRHGDGVIRADLGRFSVHNKQYFDVAVVDPTAVSYRVAEQEHLGGDVGDGMTAAAALEGENARGVLGGADRATADSAAVLARENDKKLHYRTALGDMVDNTDRLVIFVVEATGRLSSASMRFLRSLATESRDRVAVSRFVAQLGAITARSNAQLLLAWEKHVIKNHVAVSF